MVNAVSEDKMNYSIEFNEFLEMMSNQKRENPEREELMEAFG